MLLLLDYGTWCNFIWKSLVWVIIIVWVGSSRELFDTYSSVMLSDWSPESDGERIDQIIHFVRGITVIIGMRC